MDKDIIGRFAGAQDTFRTYLHEASTLRGVFIVVGVVVAAWLLMKTISRFTIGIAQVISDRADKSANEDRFVRWRQIETYLSVLLAVVRAVIVAFAGYFALRLLFPGQALLPATIGISTFFIIVAGATIAPLLRDITSGTVMILGRWLSVGDFVKIEPFADVAGVVERVTLRSTKLRDISGDIIYLHNQHIQAVRITPRGARTMAMDVFIRDYDKGLQRIEEIIQTLPIGPTMIVTPLAIVHKEKLSDDLWRVTITGQTAPSREWLIEDFIREALQGADKDKKEPVVVYGPIVRYADPSAEKRFGRAVRMGGKNKR
ncbi:MAG TPA: mechanosensitive ion channel family protein [Candidatus Saccharimonadales bacterium]|jgi:small conductance mechanosensitive channel|nr:mechanosensitive ion channel family protein [Candidatus Saccharimonadales bacterium]